MSLFFKSYEEFLIHGNDLDRSPERSLASKVLKKVCKNFGSQVGWSVGLRNDISPEMLEACFALAFGKKTLHQAAVELNRLSSEAERWFARGGDCEDYSRMFAEQLPLLQRTAEMVQYGTPSIQDPVKIARQAYCALRTRDNVERFVKQALRRVKEPARITEAA